MLRTIKLALFLFLLSAPCVALGQKKDSESSRVRLRGSGRSIVITTGRVRRRLDVKEQLLAARLDEVKLLFMTRRGSFVYLLMDACGPSKALPDARQCGAADECGLLWMKLDAAWKVQDMKAVNYESCWRTSTSSEGYKISGRSLKMEYDDFSESKHYTLLYDAEQPERGFKLEGAPQKTILRSELLKESRQSCES